MCKLYHVPLCFIGVDEDILDFRSHRIGAGGVCRIKLWSYTHQFSTARKCCKGELQATILCFFPAPQQLKWRICFYVQLPAAISMETEFLIICSLTGANEWFFHHSSRWILYICGNQKENYSFSFMLILMEHTAHISTLFKYLAADKQKQWIQGFEKVWLNAKYSNWCGTLSLKLWAGISATL